MFAFGIPLAAALAMAAPDPGAADPNAAPLPTAPSAPASPSAPSALMAPPVARPGRARSLDEVLQAALARQPQLVQARANTAASWARADEVRSPILPQLNAVASYQRTTANYAPRPGAIPTSVMGSTSAANNSFGTFNYFSAGATLSQYIWDFGLTTDRWKSAMATARATGLTEKTSAAFVTLSVRSAYFMARASRELADVAHETLDNQEKHLKQIEGFVRVGTRPMIDLYQARTNRATAEAQSITAENNYATAKAQLLLSAGMDGPVEFEIAPDKIQPVDGEEGSTDSLLGEAEHARPDMHVIDEQLRAQQLLISSAKGAYGPSLGASMSLTDAGSDVNSLGWNWNVQATATWSLFSGLLTYSQVKEQKAALAALEAQRNGLRQQIRFDVEQARLAVNAAKSTAHANTEALASARSQLQLAEGRYATGLGNVIELSDAQIAVSTSAGQLAQSELNLAIARSQLLRALGRS